MSKQKGFTLIEIIGVVVILSLLLILTVPSLTKTLKRNEQNKYNDYIDNLKIAAENYVVNKLKEGVMIDDVLVKASRVKLKNNDWKYKKFKKK